ncbi:MAG TPA: phosphoribosyltransferase [Acidisphaera sp.]|nr:phosphoribosyltransferase [Acidisphaera sp.]
MLFADRRDAGRRLAAALLDLPLKDPVVLALARGGVPVGFEVARALGAPLDVVLVRKIGAPGQEELALGAIADGEQPDLVVDPAIIAALHVSLGYIETAKAAALQEIERRRRAYLGDRPALDIAGRTAIVVDDGVATGATTRAALRATRHRRPARLVLAVPVAPADTLARLERDVDLAVCLDTPAEFWGVGQFYRDFAQVSDREVAELLQQMRGPGPITESREESR